jgi:oligopeptide transport system permease protein
MLRFTVSRFLQSLAVIIAVFTLTFFMIRLAPGDPFANEKSVHEDVKEEMRRQYGFDKPLAVQYWRTFNSYLQGDFGRSTKNQGMSNAKIIRDSLPVSITIGGAALLIALALGLPAGIIAAVRRNTWLDFGPMALAMIGICLPTFVLGPVLIGLFGLKWRLFNVAGWFEPLDWFLPALTMGLAYAAWIARLTRGGMLEVLNQDYIRTAHAKGVPGLRIILRHTLRGGLVPVAAFLGPALAGICTGSFIIEKIFNLPGLGQHFVSSVFNRDYPLTLATAVLFAALLTMMNFLADLLVAWMNPRLRIAS